MLKQLPVVLNIESIGEVLFRSDQRCKRLSIRLKPMEGVQVLFPPGYSIQSAIEFVNQKKDWVIQTRKKMEEREAGLTVFDEHTQFRSRSFCLKIEKSERSDVRLFLYNGVLKVLYPAHLPVTNEPIQEAIRYGIEEALRREAKRFLPFRLKELARQFHFCFRAVFIKNLKSRWGSCSNVNNINLNLHLMRLPDHLIDYVLIHELCHTVEKNHGASFWKLVDDCTLGKARQLDGEMKHYRTRIY
jgi:predicted metal-dependent hydrolase